MRGEQADLWRVDPAGSGGWEIADVWRRTAGLVCVRQREQQEMRLQRRTRLCEDRRCTCVFLRR